MTHKEYCVCCSGFLANIWRCTNDKLRATFLTVENAPCPINCLLYRDIFSINFRLLLVARLFACLFFFKEKSENTRIFTSRMKWKQKHLVTLQSCWRSKNVQFNEPTSLRYPKKVVITNQLPSSMIKSECLIYGK